MPTHTESPAKPPVKTPTRRSRRPAASQPTESAPSPKDVTQPPERSHRKASSVTASKRAVDNVNGASSSKVSKVTKPVKAAKPEKAVKSNKVDASKPEKVKLVRDTFTFPEGEYSQLAALKKRALGLGVEAKKGELVRVGLAMLSAASDDALRTALSQLVRLKTGRPKQ